MGVLRFVCVWAFINGVFFTGCLPPNAKINGIFSFGESPYSHEEYMIAQAYYNVPLAHFYPSEFKWDMKSAKVKLSVWCYEDLEHRSKCASGSGFWRDDQLLLLLTYDFEFDPVEFEKKKKMEGDKTIYELWFSAINEPQVVIQGVVQSYPAQINGKDRVYYFNKEDVQLTLFYQNKINGYFRGGEMYFLFSKDKTDSSGL